MRYRTKEDFVADTLREAILSGGLPRGHHLKQAELAAQLGLSVTPVREALKLLEAEGYVTRKSHHGVQVSEFDVHASEDVIGLRMLLEERLVRGAIARLQPGDLEALEQLQREFEQAIRASDRRRVRGANYRFHRNLYEIAQMSQSLHFVQVLWARYPFDLINQIEGRARRAAEEHRQLLEHLRAGDAEQAARAIRLHIQEGWVELEARLSPTRPDPRQRTGTTTQAATADPEETTR